jgi:hypothetical protein
MDQMEKRRNAFRISVRKLLEKQLLERLRRR